MTHEAPANDFLTTTSTRLEQGGWHEVSTQAGTGFDQAVVTARRGPLRVRVVRDRGRDGVDLQPEHDRTEWFDLSIVLEGVEALDGDVDFAEDVDRLDAHVEVITRAFRTDQWTATRVRMKKLERERLRRRFPNLRREGGTPV